jgi:hypothetical protein
MKDPCRLRGVALAGAAALALSCNSAEQANRGQAADNGNASARPASTANEKYPEPRWPSYFKPPKSADDLMPAARAFVRNQSGLQGKGMGILKEGESVLIVASNDADPMTMDAIERALVERKITPHIKFVYEMSGESKESVTRRQQEREKGRDITKAGIYQASSWIEGQFPNPAEPKAWLKQRRPEVYAELFPGEKDVQPAADAQPRQRPRSSEGDDAESGQPTTDYRSRFSVGEGIKKYLTANPQIRGVFWGSGGSTGLRRQLYPMQDKFLGTFVTDNMYNLQSQMSTYPGDVWQLAEEQLLEPLVYVDRVEMVDPEGMNLWADITQEMADRWAQGSYQRGHLYMFPNQATGRFGYSFVNYPAFQQKWLAREPIARINGVLAGTQGHGGFFPRWEVTFKDGPGAPRGSAERIHPLGQAEQDDVPVPQPTGVLVPVRDRVRIAPEVLPASDPASEVREHESRARAQRRHSLGPWHQAVARPRCADRVETVARVQRTAQRAVRPRLAHAHLLHHLQGAAAQREQMGEPARQGAHDEPGQS